MTEDINTATILILIVAIICLVGWLIWIIRLVRCRVTLKSRNKVMLSRFEELLRERRMVSSYEDLLSSYQSKGREEGEESQAIVDFRKTFRNLENQVRQSKLYLKEKVSKDELAELVSLDKKSFEKMFSDLSPVESVSEWIDSFRIVEALEALRQAKSEKDPDPDDDKEKKMERIAHSCGFSGRRGLNSACKRVIGMSLGELSRII